LPSNDSMNHSRLTTRAKTGLIALSVIGVSLLFIPSQKNRKPVLGETYQLVFHEIQGLGIGNSVAVGGVEAGRVIKIDFAPRASWRELNRGQGERPVVLVTVGLGPGFHLPPLSGYKILSNLKGLRMVNILPGAGDQRVSPGSIINAELDPDEVDRVSTTLEHITQLVESTRDVRRQFTDPKFQRSLKDSVSNFRFYSRELLARGKHAGAQIRSMEDGLDRQQQQMLMQIDRVDAQLGRARETIRTTYVAKAHQGAEQMKSQIASMDDKLGSLLIQADDYSHRFKDYLHNFDNSPLGSKKAKALAEQAHAMADQLDLYAGLSHDVHGLTSSPEVQKDVRDKFKDLKSRSEALKQAAAALEALSQSLQFLKAVAPAPTSAPSP
jgi:hypothetical protein